MMMLISSDIMRYAEKAMTATSRTSTPWASCQQYISQQIFNILTAQKR
jgi:hypothetical protein